MSKIPLVIAVRDPAFSQEQLDDIRRYQPAGLILFSEAVLSTDQVRALISTFKLETQNPDALIMADNEGGDVFRMRAFIPDTKNAIYFASMYDSDPEAACQGVYDQCFRVASLMKDLGFTHNCAPVCDLAPSEAWRSPTDPEAELNMPLKFSKRCYGRDPQQVADLAYQAAKAHLDNGITPIVKHMPGLGGGIKDTHYQQTVIDTPLAQMENTDFIPFQKLVSLPVDGMTTHAVFSDIDPDCAATISRKCIDVIRRTIGLKGNLFTDAFEMNGIAPEMFDNDRRNRFGMACAKPGKLGELAIKSINAGCDYILLGGVGEWSETREVMQALADHQNQKAA